jgi:hypothetical protein
MTAIEGLQSALTGLGLKAVEARLESLLEQASKKEPSYADFLAGECFHFCVSNRFPLVYCFCFDQPAAGGLAPDTTDQALGPKASSATRLSDLSSSFGFNAGFLPFEFSLVRRSGALRRGFRGRRLGAA